MFGGRASAANRRRLYKLSGGLLSTKVTAGGSKTMLDGYGCAKRLQQEEKADKT